MIQNHNVIIDEQGVVKIVDLGFAKKIDDSETKSLLGTYHAMPPEICDPNGYKYSIDFWS